ncbi:hypothetical protein PHLGIDRAFT_142431 [Phlebiopsis gigantea 11061_1 CR5-6]|uniref:Uncharacterized protein n=1 Tax=Phlebiopsis gigantea (strain 11061_1 CR5-6) TaxID=745531 RepID=A0A0C3P0Q4_PHLG1|nr:hypothetical protein PHLGIDRAFT_142431 [Phlebiopsis gigantea 11061_1 CR5-6]
MHLDGDVRGSGTAAASGTLQIAAQDAGRPSRCLWGLSPAPFLCCHVTDKCVRYKSNDTHPEPEQITQKRLCYLSSSMAMASAASPGGTTPDMLSPTAAAKALDINLGTTIGALLLGGLSNAA